MSSVPRVCSACGAASAWDARFCHQCGRPLDERTPRYYGVLSPGPAFVLGCVLLVAAVVALIAGSVIAAIVLLAVALVAFVFFYEGVSRIGASRATAFALLVPIFGVLGSVLVLGESIGAGTLVGGVVILVGLWLVQQPSQEPKTAAEPHLVAD